MEIAIELKPGFYKHKQIRNPYSNVDIIKYVVLTEQSINNLMNCKYKLIKRKHRCEYELTYQSDNEITSTISLLNIEPEFIAEIPNFKGGFYLNCNVCTNNSMNFTRYKYKGINNINLLYLPQSCFDDRCYYVYDYTNDYFIIETTPGNRYYIKPLDSKLQIQLNNKIDNQNIIGNNFLQELLKFIGSIKTEINKNEILKPRLETLLDMCLSVISEI